MRLLVATTTYIRMMGLAISELERLRMEVVAA